MPCLQLVDVIDLKWLLAGMGHRVHVERLLAEPAYAKHCLALAARTPGDELRAVAVRVGQQMGFDEPELPQAG